MTSFATECHEGVTRQGEFQPCGKLAVALRHDVTNDGRPYPVCAYHTRGFDMVPLRDVLRLMEGLR